MLYTICVQKKVSFKRFDSTNSKIFPIRNLQDSFSFVSVSMTNHKYLIVWPLILTQDLKKQFLDQNTQD